MESYDVRHQGTAGCLWNIISGKPPSQVSTGEMASTKQAFWGHTDCSVMVTETRFKPHWLSIGVKTWPTIVTNNNTLYWLHICNTVKLKMNWSYALNRTWWLQIHSEAHHAKAQISPTRLHLKERERITFVEILVTHLPTQIRRVHSRCQSWSSVGNVNKI